MELKRVADDGPLLLTCTVGDITPDSYQPEGDPLVKLAGADVYTRCVLVDLSQSAYMNSSGIGWLMVSHKRTRDKGGALVLHSVPRSIANILKVLKMDQVFHLAADETAARALAAKLGFAPAK